VTAGEHRRLHSILSEFHTCVEALAAKSADVRTVLDKIERQLQLTLEEHLQRIL
jgi:hypothetical protein